MIDHNSACAIYSADGEFYLVDYAINESGFWEIDWRRPKPVRKISPSTLYDEIIKSIFFELELTSVANNFLHDSKRPRLYRILNEKTQEDMVRKFNVIWVKQIGGHIEIVPTIRNTKERKSSHIFVANEASSFDASDSVSINSKLKELTQLGSS